MRGNNKARAQGRSASRRASHRGRIRLAAMLSAGLAGLPLAMWSCNSPDATVSGATTGSPGGTGGSDSGSGGAGGSPSGSGGQAASSSGMGGTGGAGGAGGLGGAGGAGGEPVETGPKALWAKTGGSMIGTEYATGVVIDQVGDIYVSGQFDATLKFDSEIVLLAGMETDTFLAKLNPAGAVQWVKAFGGPGYDAPAGVATDGLKMVVVGQYEETPNFGTGPLPNGGIQGNVYAAAFDPDGTLKWSKGFGSAPDPDRPYGVALDSMGNTIVTGTFEGSINFGGNTFATAGSKDIFLAKLNSAGGHTWSKSFGDSSSQEPAAVAVAPGSNRVLITGIYDGVVDFGGGPLPAGSSSYTMYVASFNADGTHHFSRKFVQDYTVEPSAMKANNDGDIYIAGNYYGLFQLDGINLLSNANDDIFLTKLHQDGTVAWAKSFGDDKFQGVSGMAVDTDGGVIVNGFFSGTVDFGGGTLTAASMCDPGEFCHDVYLVKFAPDGSHMWSRRFGGVENDFGDGVAVEPGGSLVITGSYSLDIDFGNAQSLMGDYSDIFVAKLQ